MKTFLAIGVAFEASRFQFYVLFDLTVIRFPVQFSIVFLPCTNSVAVHDSFAKNQVFLCPQAKMMDSTLFLTEVLNGEMRKKYRSSIVVNSIVVNLV